MTEKSEAQYESDSRREHRTTEVGGQRYETQPTEHEELSGADMLRGNKRRRVTLPQRPSSDSVPQPEQTEATPGEEVETYRLPDHDFAIPEEDDRVVLEVDLTKPSGKSASKHYYRNETNDSDSSENKDDQKKPGKDLVKATDQPTEDSENTKPGSTDAKDNKKQPTTEKAKDEVPSQSTELEPYQTRTELHVLRDKQGRLTTRYEHELGPDEQPEAATSEQTDALERLEKEIPNDERKVVGRDLIILPWLRDGYTDANPTDAPKQPETTKDLARIRKEVTDLALPGSETNIEGSTAPQDSAETPTTGDVPPAVTIEISQPNTEPRELNDTPKEAPPAPIQTDTTTETPASDSAALTGEVLSPGDLGFETIGDYQETADQPSAAQENDAHKEFSQPIQNTETHPSRYRFKRAKTWDSTGTPKDIPIHDSRESTENPNSTREYNPNNKTYVNKLRQYASTLENGNDYPPSRVHRAMRAAGSGMAGSAKTAGIEIAGTAGALPKALFGKLRVTEVVKLTKGLRAKLFPRAKYRLRVASGNRSTYKTVRAASEEEATGKVSGSNSSLRVRYSIARKLN